MVVVLLEVSSLVSPDPSQLSPVILVTFKILKLSFLRYFIQEDVMVLVGLRFCGNVFPCWGTLLGLWGFGLALVLAFDIRLALLTTAASLLVAMIFQPFVAEGRLLSGIIFSQLTSAII